MIAGAEVVAWFPRGGLEECLGSLSPIVCATFAVSCADRLRRQVMQLRAYPEATAAIEVAWLQLAGVAGRDARDALQRLEDLDDEMDDDVNAAAFYALTSVVMSDRVQCRSGCGSSL